MPMFRLMVNKLFFNNQKASAYRILSFFFGSMFRRSLKRFKEIGITLPTVTSSVVAISVYHTSRNRAAEESAINRHAHIESHFPSETKEQFKNKLDECVSIHRSYDP